MAHVNYSRQIRLCPSLSLEELFPQNDSLGNFAVLCGVPQQRTEIALHSIQRYVGKVGIVFIHDDPVMSDELSRLVKGKNGTNLYYANRNLSDAKEYDPLYGLNQRAVKDIILPKEKNGTSSLDITSARARLGDYLSIMEHQFKIDPSIFGNYPYNLDLLVQLTGMPYNQLESTVLNYLPSDMKDRLSSSLSADNVQQSIYDYVENFRTLAEEFLWSPSNAAAHSRISIIETVKNKDIISVQIPNSNSDLLDYIRCELETLSNARIPFLLVESGLDLLNSSQISTYFLGEHTQHNYRTGILSQSASSFLDFGKEDLSKITAQYQDIVILRCSSDAEAEPFSSAAGTYSRKVRSRNFQAHRKPFSIFSSHGDGTQISEQKERNISTDELVKLGNGAMICGARYQLPVLVQNLIL